MAKLFLIADDSQLIRASVRAMIAHKREWQICAEAANGAQALDEAIITRPDLAILDIAMPRLNGIDAGRKIIELFPSTIVLAMSMHDLQLTICHLKSAGIKGFVSKISLGSELIPAIEALLRGETYFEQALEQSAGR